MRKRISQVSDSIAKSLVVMGSDGEACAPPPIPIQWTQFAIFNFGLRLFRNRRQCIVTSRIVAAVHYFILIMGLLDALYVCVTQASRREDSAVLFILTLNSLCVYVFLRKNISRIESVFVAVEPFLSHKDLQSIARSDKWINIVQWAIMVLSFACGALAAVFGKELFRREFVAYGLTFLDSCSDGVAIVVSLLGYLVYMKIVCGIVLCSIHVYSVCMLVFGHMSRNLLHQVKRTLVDGASVASMTSTRLMLRNYWHWRQKADDVLNVFPFIWAVYLFLSTSLLLTKLVSEWQSRRPVNLFAVLCLAYAGVVAVSIAIKWPVLTAPDKTMNACLQQAFRLTDPRVTHAADDADQRLEREVMKLHLELANAPDTYSTILGSIRFNFETLISFSGALINFAVMIINIRSAIADRKA